MGKAVNMTNGQRYWEDVKEGEALEPLPKVATTQMLVRFAGASGDFSPHHYDEKLAQRWFPGTGVIVHGALKAAWLGQFVTQWAGEQGRLRRLDTQDRGMDVPRHMVGHTEAEEGETWHCRGKVVRKYQEDGENLVDLEVWVENGGGEITTPGEATLALPTREG
jgi:hypothetical protein